MKNKFVVNSRINQELKENFFFFLFVQISEVLLGFIVCNMLYVCMYVHVFVCLFIIFSFFFFSIEDIFKISYQIMAPEIIETFVNLWNFSPKGCIADCRVLTSDVISTDFFVIQGDFIYNDQIGFLFLFRDENDTSFSIAGINWKDHISCIDELDRFYIVEVVVDREHQYEPLNEQFFINSVTEIPKQEVYSFSSDGHIVQETYVGSLDFTPKYVGGRYYCFWCEGFHTHSIYYLTLNPETLPYKFRKSEEWLFFGLFDYVLDHKCFLSRNCNVFLETIFLVLLVSAF